MAVLRAGIKAVGVGVSGSKPIPEEHVAGLIAVVKAAVKRETPEGKEWEGQEEEIRQRLASFLGALFVKTELKEGDEVVLAAVASVTNDKKPTGHVRAGCSSSQVLAVAAGEEGSAALRGLALRLLGGHRLSTEEARELGGCLFDPTEPSHLQVMCAQILRVRYETMDEWTGLLEAQHATLDLNRFGKERMPLRGGERVVQLAEPFDGTHKAESFSPLIARHLQRKWGALAVSQCAQTAGPKYGPNAYTLAKVLCPDAFVTDVEQMAKSPPPEFGWYVDQAVASSELGRWNDIRRNVIKRPFLATSEKFLDTCGAEVVIASAFHPSFSEKMFQMVARACAFKALVIVRRGVEGGLGLSLARPAEITCGVRQTDGTMKRLDFKFGPQHAGIDPRPETAQQSPPLSSSTTASKIARYAEDGASGDPIFDDRVRLTLMAYDAALEFVCNGNLVVEPLAASDPDPAS